MPVGLLLRTHAGHRCVFGLLGNMSHFSQQVAATRELNGSTREFSMPAELWCYAEADWRVESWVSHWFTPG